MDKYHPGYFGKVGMRTFHYKRNPDYCKGINIDRLWSMVPPGVYETAKADTSKAPVIDVTKLVRLPAFFLVLAAVLVACLFFSSCTWCDSVACI